MTSYQDFFDPIQQAAERNKSALDGFDIHKGYGYDQLSATFLLDAPEVRKTSFAIAKPEFYKPGNGIAVNVIKGTLNKFHEEQHRLKLCHIEILRLEEEVNRAILWKKDGSTWTHTARSLAILAQINEINKTLWNTQVDHEYAMIRGIGTYNGVRNVLELDRVLQYQPFAGGAIVCIVSYDKKYVNARIADLPEHKWGSMMEIDEHIGETLNVGNK